MVLEQAQPPSSWWYCKCAASSLSSDPRKDHGRSMCYYFASSHTPLLSSNSPGASCSSARSFGLGRLPDLPLSGERRRPLNKHTTNTGNKASLSYLPPTPKNTSTFSGFLSSHVTVLHLVSGASPFPGLWIPFLPATLSGCFSFSNTSGLLFSLDPSV